MANTAAAVRDATQDAVNGLRAVVLTNSLDSARNMHKAFQGVDIGDIPRKFNRGKLRVDFPEHGGSILFQSIRGVRGLSADHIYLPANLASPALMEEIAPAVCASRDPAIIGCL